MLNSVLLLQLASVTARQKFGDLRDILPPEMEPETLCPPSAPIRECHAEAEQMESEKQAKEKVREYLERRQAERRKDARAPLHDAEEIRREIGWDQTERRQSDRRRR